MVEITREGARELPRGRANLMVKAAEAVLAGRIDNRLVFKAVNRIPQARGLGSSAAAIVAGLFAANRLLKPDSLTDEQLFERAVAMEGHPDNAAPAIHGGLVVSIREAAGVRVHSLKPHRDLCAVVCVPDFELSTAKARGVLPKTVAMADAVENIARALLLSSALERGRWDALAAAMQDRLHQPHRSHLVRGFNTVLRAAREAGTCGAALSGSGPSFLALCRKGPAAAKIGRAMRRAFLRHGVESRALVLPIDRAGVTVST
jgi:homoserine kinase